MEVSAHAPHLDPAAGLDAAHEAGDIVRAAGLDVIAYGSYLGRFGQTTGQHAEREAAIAAALGTSLLRVWAEPIEEGNYDVAPVVDLMQAAADAAAAAGVTVVIERHLGSFADTSERIDDLFQRIGRPNVALNYQVLDFLPEEALPGQAADATQLIGRARYVHLKNYQFNEPRGGMVLPGGSLKNGVLDYRAILAAIVASGYDGPLTIEFLAADERSVEDKLRSDVDFVLRTLDAVRHG